MNIRTTILTGLATALIAGNAYACGDSLYRVGKGVSYRVYTAPLPGSVLVYGTSEGAEQLAAELARSGHGVRLVDSDEALQNELGTGDYDVVAQSDAEESAARQDYERVMVAENDEIKHYLKAIHQTLKASR